MSFSLERERESFEQSKREFRFENNFTRRYLHGERKEHQQVTFTERNRKYKLSEAQIFAITETSGFLRSIGSRLHSCHERNFK